MKLYYKNKNHGEILTKIPPIWKKSIKYILISLLAAASLYFVGKDIDFALLWKILKEANYFWAAVSVPVILISHWIRAVRWKTFLKPILEAKSMLNLFSAVMIGYAVNNVIPRGGELVRPFVFARREKVSRSAVFATIIIERFIDVLYLLFLFALVFFINRSLITFAFPWMTNANLLLYVVLPIAVLLSIILLSVFTQAGHWLLKVIVKPLSEKEYLKFSDILTNFLKGFEFIKTPKQYTRTLMDSTLMWLFYALPMYMMFFCFDFQSGLHLGVQDAGLLLIVVGIGVSIAPTPGAIGVQHYLVTTAMVGLYAISKEEALAYATLVHAVNLIVQVVVGAGFFFRENISKLPSKDEFEQTEEII